MMLINYIVSDIFYCQHVIDCFSCHSYLFIYLPKQGESMHEAKIKSERAIGGNVAGKKIHGETGKDRNEWKRPGLIHAERGEHYFKKAVLSC